jgi:hypothetical protein
VTAATPETEMSEPNPRAVLGGNKPPLTPPEDLVKRLDLEHAALFAEAANLDAEQAALPDDLKTDEDSAAVSAFVVKLKTTARKVEGVRVEEGRPYLEATRIVNETFKSVTEQLEASAKALTARVGIYNKAKAERERAERLRLEQEQRQRAEEQRAEEQRLREAAETAAREADEAAARIRQAETAEDYEAAAADMRQREAAAGIARDAAEGAAKTAAQAERKADTAARQADGPTSTLSRVSGLGATSSVTKRWVGEITDRPALVRSLGALGPFFSDNELDTLVARAVRLSAASGAISGLRIPGCVIEQRDYTNIRAAR